MEEKVISIINQEIKCSQGRLSKDITSIIASYYFLISEEFKLELKNIMKDRIDRKLEYIARNNKYYLQINNGHEFVVKSIIHGKPLYIHFHSNLFQYRGNILCNISIIYLIDFKQKSTNHFLSKSFNRLTNEEFLALE